MLYFKNAELAEAHHISLRTVLNWIEATKQGKLGLTLYTQGEKSYVANTARNIAIIEQLVEDRRKYRNKRSVKVVTPKPAFYELYDGQQVLDIVSHLDIYHEIPRQYNYFSQGAHYWDQYANRLAAEESPNVLTRTVELLDINAAYIDYLIKDYDQVNVIDVGIGNALPARVFLEHLLYRGKLGRYIGLDISVEMLQIARDNIKEWFGESVEYEGYEIDINYDRFARLLTAGSEKENNPSKVANIILVLGGTFGNFRAPDAAFKIVHDSMGRNDMLIYSNKLDTASSRRYFDFSAAPQNTALAPNHRFIFDLLGMNDTFYDVEMGFDRDMAARYIRVRLKLALIIQFKCGNTERTVEFNKGDTILLWRSWHQSALDILDQLEHNEFYSLHASQTEDNEYLLAIAKIKTSDLL